MNRSKNLIHFIFLCILIQQASTVRRGIGGKVPVERESVTIMKRYMAENKFCLDGSDYQKTYRDATAAKMYVQKYCNKNFEGKAADYLRSTYGNEIKVMGQGSFGKVSHYRNARGEDFAIKVPKSFSYDDVMIEINTSECIRSKTVEEDRENVNNYALITECVWPTTKSPHLTMRFFPETLTKRIKTYYTAGYDSLSDNKQLDMLRDMAMLATEMTYLHHLNIAHRDIKPDNVMIAANGMPHIGDFGTGSPIGSITRGTAGTPYYLDYNLIDGKSVGIEADIYSLCITFAAMLTQPTFNKQIGIMLTKGGYGKSGYKPAISWLKLPVDFAWLSNMFKAYNTRWKAIDVKNKLNEMYSTLEEQIKSKRKFVDPVKDQLKRSTSVLVQPKSNIKQVLPVDKPQLSLEKVLGSDLMSKRPAFMNNFHQKQQEIVSNIQKNMNNKDLPPSKSNNMVQKENIRDMRIEQLQKEIEIANIDLANKKKNLMMGNIGPSDNRFKNPYLGKNIVVRDQEIIAISSPGNQPINELNRGPRFKNNMMLNQIVDTTVRNKSKAKAQKKKVIPYANREHMKALNDRLEKIKNRKKIYI